MSLIFKDRVCETTTTTGTGTYTLAGAKTGYIAFSGACANGDMAYYTATNGVDFEVGLGTWATGGTLARTTIYASSNSGSAVSWAAGSKDIFLDVPAYHFSNPNPAGFRNRIINGDMSIDQRNAGAAKTFTAGADWAYCVDRWTAAVGGANVSGQRVAGSGASQYNYMFTGAASVTGISFGQRIEAANIYDLAGTTVTLSVFLANSVLTTVSWSAAYANTTDTFSATTSIASGTFTVNSTFTRYSANIALPANANRGVVITFSVGAQTSGTFTVGDVQLEPGLLATTFERRPLSTELSLCRRYYEQTAVLNSYIGACICASGAAPYLQGFPFMVQKRSLPIVTLYSRNGTAGKVSSVMSGVDVGTTLTPNASTQMVSVIIDSGSGFTAGQLYEVNYTAFAEL